jgi:ASPM-SPD-2-Hydin domain-containing protein
VTASNYQLKGGSPAIDAGSNSAPNLPTKDFVNNPRIINGNGSSTAIVDMGAYEFVPVVLAPKSLSFGLQAVGSTTSKTVKLTNAQNKALNVSSYTVPIGYSVSGCGSSVAAFTSCPLTVTFHPLTSGTFKGSLVVKDDAGNSPQTVPLSGSAH